MGEHLSYAELSKGAAPLGGSDVNDPRLFLKPLVGRLEDRVTVCIHAKRDTMPGNDPV
jgi:hypothetical protein